jgi:hypothetical protein
MKDRIETDRVSCRVISESASAVKLEDGNDTSRVAWFPKSQIHFRSRNINTGIAVAEIPLWLLKSKGWDE